MASTNTSKTTKSTTSSTSTDYDNVVVVLCARARAREEQQQRQAAAIDAAADYWRIAIGTQLPPIGRRRIGELLEQGVEPELLADIIDATSAAPRPSWAYCAAICERIERAGITTQQAYRDAQAARAALAGRKAAKMAGNAGDYEQRQYDNAKLAYLYEDN